jgi:hypothetical protein
MKPEIKALWLDALRSGEYEQGRNKLHTWDDEGVERFCCLGVLCDLAVQNGVEIPIVEDDDDKMYCYDTEVEFLPEAVMEWSGLWSNDGDYEFEGDPNAFGTSTNGSVRGKLSHLNDSGASFSDIANEIEQWL